MSPKTSTSSVSLPVNFQSPCSAFQRQLPFKGLTPEPLSNAAARFLSNLNNLLPKASAVLTPSVRSDAFWRRRYCFGRGTLRMKSENRLSKGRCCMERSAEDGSFTPWLSQIDNVTRLYQTGKLWCHLGREQSDHP